jgi:hypothetical protein
MRDATPRPRCWTAVRIDLISPLVGPSSSSAPHPTSSPWLQTDQKVTSEAKTGEVERVDAAGRGDPAHVFEVPAQERDDRLGGQIVLADLEVEKRRHGATDVSVFQWRWDASRMILPAPSTRHQMNCHSEAFG